MTAKKLILALVTILCISMTVPMIYAPNRIPHGQGVQFVEENDPSLRGNGMSMLAALDQVEKLEDSLGVDLTEKSTLSELTPKEQAKLDRAIAKANDRIDRFLKKADFEITYEKSTGVSRYIGETEKNLDVFLKTKIIWLS